MNFNKVYKHHQHTYHSLHSAHSYKQRILDHINSKSFNLNPKLLFHLHTHKSLV